MRGCGSGLGGDGAAKIGTRYRPVNLVARPSSDACLSVFAVAFVRQANIANGPQQVNNGPPPPADASRARECENPPNKLLEQRRNEWLDCGTVSATVRTDQELAPVGEVHGTNDDRG
jgi:hypothetical protein